MTAPRRCCFCGDTEVPMHHPTQDIWDPAIVVPVCHDHHMLIHDDWYTAGIGPKAEPPTVLHVLAMNMHRWAMLLGRLSASSYMPEVLSPLATWLITWAAILRAACDALDTSFPQWRSLAALTPTMHTR